MWAVLGEGGDGVVTRWLHCKQPRGRFQLAAAFKVCKHGVRNVASFEKAPEKSALRLHASTRSTSAFCSCSTMGSDPNLISLAPLATLYFHAQITVRWDLGSLSDSADIGAAAGSV
jgi:hypothetical protein